jgi:hypothetical protein
MMDDVIGRWKDAASALIKAAAELQGCDADLRNLVARETGSQLLAPTPAAELEQLSEAARYYHEALAHLVKLGL